VNVASRFQLSSIRNGKIARLPEQIREQINRRLEDGENGRTSAPKGRLRRRLRWACGNQPDRAPSFAQTASSSAKALLEDKTAGRRLRVRSAVVKYYGATAALQLPGFENGLAALMRFWINRNDLPSRSRLHYSWRV
jgi:hypothetical protein